MIGLDIMGCITFLGTLIVFMFLANLPFFIAILCTIVICLPLAFILKWPQRFVRSRKRSEIMHHKIQTAYGMFDYTIPYDTGKKENHIIYDSFTQRGLTGEIYSHYHTKTFKVYDGQVGSFIVFTKEKDHCVKTSRSIELRTMPKGFFNRTESLPECRRMYKIHFVTHVDGTNYLIEAIPAN